MQNTQFLSSKIQHIHLHLVSFYMCRVFFFFNSFLSLSLFFPQTKNTSCKTHCFLPCQVCSGRRWRQQTAGPPCSESGLPLSGSLPAKQT